MMAFVPDWVMLPICVCGIYGFYLLYGYLQEELISIERINPLLPLLSQYIMAIVVAFVFNLVTSLHQGRGFEISTPMEFYLGALTTLTMTTSNYALSYVDYPTQALLKSSKILPVLAFGWVRKTYNYSLYKYV
jgi:adenosine 3'-phospho 5'-phosphosulfate transporter B3